MLATIEESPDVSAALSACLVSWCENPYRLISLHEMLQVFAQEYVELGRALQAWVRSPEVIAAPFQNFSNDENTAFLESLEAIRAHCQALGLPVCDDLAHQTIAQVNASAKTVRRDEAANRMAELHRCLIAELKSKLFFHVPAHRTPYVHLEFTDAVGNITPFLGSELKKFNDAIASFPSIGYDVRQAGNAFTCSLFTACVFHLMRVLERGLTSLGAIFDVSLAHTNWAPALEQIESKIREMHKEPAWKDRLDYKEQQEFYAQAASHFGIFKDAWRNYTAHARGKYDEQEAESIFRSVRAFMQKLATRIHE